MKVSIKDLQVSMTLGNNGIELDVYDNQDKHLGDLHIGKAKLVWCNGKTNKNNGVSKSWTEVIEFFNAK